MKPTWNTRWKRGTFGECVRPRTLPFVIGWLWQCGVPVLARQEARFGQLVASKGKRVPPRSRYGRIGHWHSTSRRCLPRGYGACDGWQKLDHGDWKCIARLFDGSVSHLGARYKRQDAQHCSAAVRRCVLWRLAVDCMPLFSNVVALAQVDFMKPVLEVRRPNTSNRWSRKVIFDGIHSENTWP
jgi:hypothetical protein